MKINELDTPALLVDYDKLLRNLERMGKRVAGTSTKIRPHIKTHKCPPIAHLQLKHGARGLTAAKLGEAQIMAEAGVEDLLIAYPIIGEVKIARLLQLRTWVPKVACTVDSLEGARALSCSVLRSAFRADEPLDVYIEVDVGLGRVGLAPGRDVVEFAASIQVLKGIRIRGILTHAGHAHLCETPQELLSLARLEAAEMVKTAVMLRQRGIQIEEVSIGSTPTASVLDRFEGISEIRPGTYVFNDANLLGLGVVGLDDCALSVLTTVISRPAPDRIIFDAGSKVFSSDTQPPGRIPGYGVVKGYPDLWLERLSEEHGIAKVFPGATSRWNRVGQEEINAALPPLGAKVQIVPNHACPVVNLFDKLTVTKGDRVVTEWRVQARGLVT